MPFRRYDEAVKQAVEWFDHRKSGGISASITLADACQRYIDKLRGSGKENGAVDVEGRFKRWVFSDTKLSKTALIKTHTRHAKRLAHEISDNTRFATR